jgi:cbb3-type cytochrome oxidase subunit 3
LFFVMFIGVLIYVLRPANRCKFEDGAQIPLRED